MCRAQQKIGSAEGEVPEPRVGAGVVLGCAGTLASPSVPSCCMTRSNHQIMPMRERQPRVGAGVVLGWAGTLASPSVPSRLLCQNVHIRDCQHGRRKRPHPTSTPLPPLREPNRFQRWAV